MLTQERERGLEGARIEEGWPRVLKRRGSCPPGRDLRPQGQWPGGYTLRWEVSSSEMCPCKNAAREADALLFPLPFIFLSLFFLFFLPLSFPFLLSLPFARCKRSYRGRHRGRWVKKLYNGTLDFSRPLTQ